MHVMLSGRAVLVAFRHPSFPRRIFFYFTLSMDNSHYELIFYLDKSRKYQIPGKNLPKVAKFQNLVVKSCIKYGKYSLASSQIFYIFVISVEIATIFDPKVIVISARIANTIMRKFANFVRLNFPHITIFFNLILESYYF